MASRERNRFVKFQEALLEYPLLTIGHSVNQMQKTDAKNRVILSRYTISKLLPGRTETGRSHPSPEKNRRSSPGCYAQTGKCTNIQLGVNWVILSTRRCVVCVSFIILAEENINYLAIQRTFNSFILCDGQTFPQIRYEYLESWRNDWRREFQ